MNSYVLTISRGEQGLKIPAGFARVDPDSALVKLFTQSSALPSSLRKSAMVCEDIDKMIWKNSLIKTGTQDENLLKNVSNEMRLFETAACIPSYFQNRLLGILLLGGKISGEDFSQEELDFFSALASDVAMAISNAQLFKDLQDELKRNKDLFLRTTIALAAAIEAKDLYTRGHTERVTQISLAIAQKLIGFKTYTLPENFLENLHIASLLHDIGKIGIPEAILNKPGKLTDEEFKIIKEHTLKGVAILQPIKELEECIAAVKYHHERYDGKGYPEGLSADKIPLIAAIISVADAYDAMIIDRPYRRARTREDAVEEIKRCSGSQFNPVIAECFLQLVQSGKI
jgi:HD-GYP domain-containing protein (c-di-GMP phosphodiesterase class II)